MAYGGEGEIKDGNQQLSSHAGSQSSPVGEMEAGPNAGPVVCLS